MKLNRLCAVYPHTCSIGFLGSVFWVLGSVGLRGAQRSSALSPSGFCVLSSVFWVLGVLGVLWVLTLSRGGDPPKGAESSSEEEPLTWPPHIVCAEFKLKRLTTTCSCSGRIRQRARALEWLRHAHATPHAPFRVVRRARGSTTPRTHAHSARTRAHTRTLTGPATPAGCAAPTGARAAQNGGGWRGGALLQVAALQVTRTQVHPPPSAQRGCRVRVLHHKPLHMWGGGGAASSSSSRRPCKHGRPPAAQPAPAPAHNNAPIRAALASAGPPLLLAVRAVADGGRQGCMRASRQRDKQGQCGAVRCGVVRCGVVW